MSPLGDSYRPIPGNWVDLTTGLTIPGGGGGGPTDGRFPGDPGVGKMYYGAAFESGYDSVDQMQTRLGHFIGLEREYWPDSASAVAGMGAFLDKSRTANRLPWVSSKVPNNDWAAVAAGTHDSWLTQIKNIIAARAPHPVWFCMHHEPRTDGNPSDFVAMYEHAIPILKQATNVAVAPILNGYSFNPVGGDPDPSVWYTPSADFIAYDAYNQWWSYDKLDTAYNGKTADGGYRPWLTTAKEFGYPAQTIRSWGKETAVAEWGVKYAWNEPGKAATYMDDSYNYCLSTVPHLAMSWFHSGQNSPRGPWYLDNHYKPMLPYPLDTTLYPDTERINKFKAALSKAGTYYLP